MDCNSAWGSEIEMIALANLLNTNVYIYNTIHGDWSRYKLLSEGSVDNIREMSMYLSHPPSHFDVVASVRKQS